MPAKKKRRKHNPRDLAADIVPLTTAEKAAVLHAIAQLDGKATQKKAPPRGRVDFRCPGGRSGRE